MTIIYDAFLSSSEINELLANPIVSRHKEKLLDLQKMVDFSVPLTGALKEKLENVLAIDLSQITSLPLKWVRGDTPEHRDKGESPFKHTYLIYVTDSIGKLIVDKQSYAIKAGQAYKFIEGLPHSTVDTSDYDRLMIGPMSEFGSRVGGGVFISFTTNTFTDFESGKGFQYFCGFQPQNITIFNVPPPTPVSGSSSSGAYIISQYATPADWNPPPGKKFGGWKGHFKNR